MGTFVKEKKKLTYQDYMKTPDDERYELVNGELIEIPAPFIIHQRISRELGVRLYTFIKENDLGEIFTAPCDVVFDDENVHQPDLLFISKERSRIIGEKNVEGAPDIAIEIISKSSAYTDYVVKKGLNEKFGVKEYWIVIPDEKMIEIYLLQGNKYTLFKQFNVEETLESPTLKGFKLTLKEIF